MAPVIDPSLRQQPKDPIPTFLYSTPDGFEDREECVTHRELVAQLVKADPLVKLFEGNSLVHTSEDCGNDPYCPKCEDRRARHYVRLLLDADGTRYQLDLPPSARKRFLALADEIGDDDAPTIHLTSTPKQMSNGRPWAHIEFSLVGKEAA